MALQLTEKANFGVEITYWSIKKLDLDFDTKDAYIQLAGYRSEEHKKEEKEQPVRVEFFNFSGDKFVFTKGGNNFEEAYTAIQDQGGVGEDGEMVYTKWHESINC